MILSSPQRRILMYLHLSREEQGYGTIAYHTGNTRVFVENECLILSEQRMLECGEGRVWLTQSGKDFIEGYLEQRDERIREFVYEDYEFALLRFVIEWDDPLSLTDFPEVLKEEAPRETRGNELMNLKHAMEIKWRSYFQNVQNKLVISPSGRKRYEFLLKQKGIQDSDKTNGSPNQHNFSSEDQKKMNEKLDEVVKYMKEEFDQLKLGQEIIWSDIKEDMEELKNLYHLNKKNWRQLVTGKLTEMVVSRVISETVSKKIIDFVNPTTTQLLEYFKGE